mmetsp:Transcript_20733/g.42659  ORF Transcript_20733/g.42659 Transcript_20733/m.42659 type:complete len:239 (+) Transcript_20733:124-840(+)
MMFRQRISALLLLQLIVSVWAAYEVPMEKAYPPKMDPIPTLPLVTERVFLEIAIGGDSIGKIVFGLFGEIAPKAVQNFSSLCKCDKGKAPITGKDMCYKGSSIHRVIPNFIVQGGDYTHGDGTGGESIFEGNTFEDESFAVKHNRKYLLNMAHDGPGKPNTNRSQWFINTCKTQWLDGINEVFGMVLDGIDVITEIETRGTFGGEPTKTIEIVDSGSLPLEPEDAIPYYVSDKLEQEK